MFLLCALKKTQDFLINFSKICLKISFGGGNYCAGYVGGIFTAYNTCAQIDCARHFNQSGFADFFNAFNVEKYSGKRSSHKSENSARIFGNCGGLLTNYLGHGVILDKIPPDAPQLGVELNNSTCSGVDIAIYIESVIYVSQNPTISHGVILDPSGTQIYRRITQMFMHGGLLHLIANLVGLYFIGFF